MGEYLRELDSPVINSMLGDKKKGLNLKFENKDAHSIHISNFPNIGIDRYRLTSELKTEIVKSASRVRGDDEKFELLIKFLDVAKEIVVARYLEEKRVSFEKE